METLFTWEKLMGTKEQIRNKMIEERSKLSKEEKQRYSNLIMDRLILYLAQKNVKHLLLYADFRNEVETRQLANFCHSYGISLYFPKVFQGDMEFYLSSMEELSPLYMGIREPSANENKVFQFHKCKAEQVFMVMPALAFDKMGNRVGYGKGYYDRYLTRNPIQNRIGICYEFQIVEAIPAKEFDIKVTRIFTEKNMIPCNEHQ